MTRIGPSIALLVVLGPVGSVALAEEGKGSGEPYDPNTEAGEVIEDSPFEELEVACIEQLEGPACYEAARSWHEGRGIPKPNPLQAFNLYKAGCAFEYAPACVAGATMILRAQAGFFILRPDGILSLDFGEASTMAGRACSLGYLSACGMYGDLMMDPDGQLPNEGTIHRNIRHDPLAARQAYLDGCPEQSEDDSLDSVERDTRSCVRLAQLFEAGSAGFSKDFGEALKYYQLACDASEGEKEYCDKADLMEAEGPKQEERERKRTSVQPRRPKPDIARFRDSPDALIEANPQEMHHRRFDLELGIGARWLYGPGSLAGMKLRFGMNAWFNVVGFSLDSGFMTDKFANVPGRTYLRFQQGFGANLAFPIPHRLRYPITIRVVVGVGGTLGTLKRGPSGDFLLSYGVRQRVQAEAGTNQATGARQFLGLRVEQQQTWYADTGSAIEHSTQVVFLAGFTFGGLHADWRPNKN